MVTSVMSSDEQTKVDVKFDNPFQKPMRDRPGRDLISIDDLVLRADRHKWAAVSAGDFDAFRSICAPAVAA